MMTNTNSLTYKCQVAAIILMTAGWAWSGGNFTPQGAPIWNYLAHSVPILLLLVLAIPMLRVRGTQQSTESKAGWVTVGMSIFAVVGIIGAIVLIVLGATNPDPNSVGVHSFADWFPTTILIMGNLLWLATLIPARLGHADASTASNQA